MPIDLEMYYGPEENWDETDDPDLLEEEYDDFDPLYEPYDYQKDDFIWDDDDEDDWDQEPYDPIDPPDYSHYLY